MSNSNNFTSSTAVAAATTTIYNDRHALTTTTGLSPAGTVNSGSSKTHLKLLGSRNLRRYPPPPPLPSTPPASDIDMVTVEEVVTTDSALTVDDSDAMEPPGEGKPTTLPAPAIYTRWEGREGGREEGMRCSETEIRGTFVNGQ